MKKLQTYKQDFLTILSGTTCFREGDYEKKIAELLDVYLEQAYEDGHSAGLSIMNN